VNNKTYNRTFDFLPTLVLIGGSTVKQGNARWYSLYTKQHIRQ